MSIRGKSPIIIRCARAYILGEKLLLLVQDPIYDCFSCLFLFINVLYISIYTYICAYKLLYLIYYCKYKKNNVNRIIYIMNVFYYKFVVWEDLIDREKLTGPVTSPSQSRKKLGKFTT